MIHVRTLHPDEAPAEHRRCLADAMAGGVNLSFGLFDGDRLVGHLICCGFKPTIFPGEIGEALHVRHLAVLPRYRRMLPKLLRRLGLEARHHFPGSVIEAHAVESVFALPGLGSMLVQGIAEHDYPVIQGVLLVSTFAVLVIGFLADLAQRIIDPRLRAPHLAAVR